MEPSSAHNFMTIQKKQNWVTEKKKWLQNGITPILKIARWENEKIFLGSCHAWDLGVLYCGSRPNPLLPFSFCPHRQPEWQNALHFSLRGIRKMTNTMAIRILDLVRIRPSCICLFVVSVTQQTNKCVTMCQSFIMLKLFSANILWLVLERVKISESWIQSCVKSSYWS